MNLAYVRVSTVEQNEARQIEALEGHGIDRWYIEKVSGKNTADREQFRKMLSEAQEGDTIFVHDLSRFARSTLDLLTVVKEMEERKIHLYSNKEMIDTSTPTGKLFLTIIGGIAEFERTNMLERQREGIAIAKRNGAYKNCGRKEKEVDPVEFAKCKGELLAGALTKSAMALRLGISRPTLYKLLEENANG